MVSIGLASKAQVLCICDCLVESLRAEYAKNKKSQRFHRIARIVEQLTLASAGAWLDHPEAVPSELGDAW